MSQAVDVKPCLPAFAADALFPIALTLLILGLIATGALIWAARRTKERTMPLIQEPPARQEATPWSQVHDSLTRALGVAFDGCHKVYLLMDEGQVEQMGVVFGYGQDDDESVLYRFTDDPVATKALVHDIWECTCSLRFISAVSTGPDGSVVLDSLIDQFDEQSAEVPTDES